MPGFSEANMLAKEYERQNSEQRKADIMKEQKSNNQKEIKTTSVTGGQKGVKLERFDLIPIRPLEELARLYGYGATKYAPRNWQKGYEFSKSYASLLRHLVAFWNGEDFDEETGCHHLSSVAFHAFALMEFNSYKEYNQFDDRPIPRQKISNIYEAKKEDEARAITNALAEMYFEDINQV